MVEFFLINIPAILLLVFLFIVIICLKKICKKLPSTKNVEATNVRSEALYLRNKAQAINIPEDAIDRFTEKYMSEGMTEVQALQKMIDDTIRDRARYSG